MKNVLIIGAAGSLARCVVAELRHLEDIKLTLFLRNKGRLPKNMSEGCTLIEGDALNYNDVVQAIAGKDVVYVNLAGNLGAMAKNIVSAMKEQRVRRIIAISSIGIYETPLRQLLLPYRKLADIVEGSGLDYTILRPDWFTNVNEVDYVITRKGQPETGAPVSRKSIAAFIAAIIEDPRLHKNENLGISKPE